MSDLTRGEAIQVLQTALTSPFIYGEYADAIGIAIEAMAARPYGRLIDADALYTKATELWDKSDSEDFEKGIFKLILNAPTVSAELTVQTPQTYGKSINPSNAEVVEDLISRADAIEAVVAKVKWFDGDAIEDRCKRDAFMQVLDEILTALPSADDVQGEWVHDGQNFKGGLDWCHCSVCGQKTSTNGLSMYNFCPNCGARMKGGDSE